MKFEEMIAEKHLRFRGFQNVQHHPDGPHHPPDFLVDGTIAVEVRRLNQNERGRETPKGLEVEAIPLTGRLDKLLATFGSDGPTRWYVMLQLKRPLPKWSLLRHRVRAALQAVLDQREPPDRVDLEVDSNVHLELVQRSTPSGPTFALGSRVDADSGGWLLEELERNLRLCITEKTAKVAAHRARYTAWWLLFVDLIGYGLPSEESRQDFRASVSVDHHDWERIILVNPLDYRHHFEI